MTPDQRLVSERFPRSSQYHPEWVLANISGGANSLWLTEWLTVALDLRPGMRVLDLGCGWASSSIFLRREFGVQVWATDLWFSARRTSSASEMPASTTACFRSMRTPDPCGRPIAAVRRGILRRHRVHRFLLLLRDGRGQSVWPGRRSPPTGCHGKVTPALDRRRWFSPHRGAGGCVLTPTTSGPSSIPPRRDRRSRATAGLADSSTR